MTAKVKPQPKAATAAALVEEKDAKEFGKFFRTCILAVIQSRYEDTEYTDAGGGHTDADGKPMTGHEAAVCDAYWMAKDAFKWWEEWRDENKLSADFSKEGMKEE